MTSGKLKQKGDISDVKKDDDTHWNVFVDKGYYGIHKYLGAIISKKTPPLTNPTNQKRKATEDLAVIRSIVKFSFNLLNVSR